MIAMTKIGTDIRNGNKPVYEITGLSTDTKPINSINNGSRYIEMDTGIIYFFDEENKKWIDFNGQEETNEE